MREFIRRALLKTSRMNADQMQSLLSLVIEEYELLDSVLDSLATGVLVCDTFHILVQFNKAASRILPFETHDIIDRPIWECIENDGIADFIQDCIENEEAITAREFVLEEYSVTRYLNIRVMPLVRSKSVRGTIITVDDISEKKNDELRNRRMESLASLTNLAATVAHEVKNPLGSMSIYMQLIRKAFNKCEVSNSSQMQQYLDIVDEEIERLNKIVVDFLFAVRPISFDFAPLSLNNLITSLSSFFSEECSQSKIDIELDLEKQLPLVRGDERFLRQMFINLVKNSIAAMSHGGILRFTSTAKEDSILIQLSDTGSGIPETVLANIFEPYFSTKVDGTGLGLTMAYKVVKEHNGDIRVQSELGKGTTFTIKLPILRRAQKMLEYEEYEKQ